MTTTSDQCEGCDLPGSADWCGTWLCAACLTIEQEEADPVLKAQREAERKQRAAMDWPASQRGDTMASQVYWICRTMDALVRESCPDHGDCQAERVKEG